MAEERENRDAYMPERQRPTPRSAPHEYDQDEISFRDLYLILKRGMPLIIGVALVAGAVAFLGATLRPKQFQAEATVLSSPSAVSVQDEGTLAFDPRNAVTFETYRTIATSRGVFEETVARISASSEPGSGPLYRDLQSAADLEQLTGPSNPTQVVPLTVLHRLTWPDAEQAATFVNAWADTTVETMRRTLLGNYDPVLSTTSAAVETRSADLDALEERLESFQSRDNSAELEATIDALTTEVAEGRRRLNEIVGTIEIEGTRLEALARQFGETDSTLFDSAAADQRSAAARLAQAQTMLETFDRENAVSTLQAEIDFLLGRSSRSSASESGGVSSIVLTQNVQGKLPELRQRLRDIPRQIAGLEAQIATSGPEDPQARGVLAGLRAEQIALEQQVQSTEAYLGDLQSRAADLSSRRSMLETLVLVESLRSEQGALEEQLTQTREEMADARDQLSRLERERSQLSRQMEIAQSAYASVAELEQLVEFVTELTPGGTRVINSASVPVTPSGTSRTFIGVLALVLGGMVATLFVFLREAVREPSQHGSQTGSPS